MSLPDGMKVIVQARLESRRLPAKVLAPILGQPMLLLQLDRLAGGFAREQIVVATADTPENAALAALVRRHGYRACQPSVSPEDVLGRYVAVSQELGAETVIRVTGDCPLIDSSVIRDALTLFDSQPVDYVALAPEWPDGLDVEIMRAEALRTADREATTASDREHVSAFVWRHPERFRATLLPCPLDLRTHSWSVDTPRDLTWMRAVYAGVVAQHGPAFGWRHVLIWLAWHPGEARQAQDHPRNAAYVAQVAAETGGAVSSWTRLRYGEKEESTHG